MAWVMSEYSFVADEKPSSKMIFKPYMSDLNCFRVIKIRNKTNCNECDKPIPPKSYAYGEGWTRLCLDCGEKFSDRGIDGLKWCIKFIKDNQKKLKKNKDKWKAENTLAKL